MSRTDQIADYLANRMSPADLEAFELELLTDSELQAEVSTQLALKRSLQTLHAESDDAVPLELLYAQPSVIYVETLRGCPASVELDSGPTLLAVDCGPGVTETLSIEIKDRAQVISREVAEVDEEGYVNVLVPALTSGSYQCDIQSSQVSKTLLIAVTEGK